jgi:hypothetical protein
VVQVPGAIDTVAVLKCLVLLAAESRVDDHRPCAADDQRPHAERAAVTVVGGRHGGPLRLRHAAEHQPAVHPQKAVGQGDQFELAQRESRDRRGAADGGPIGHPRLLELDQHAVRRRGMDERDRRAFAPGRGCSVDQPDAARSEMVDYGADVVDRVMW